MDKRQLTLLMLLDFSREFDCCYNFSTAVVIWFLDGLVECSVFTHAADSSGVSVRILGSTLSALPYRCVCIH